MKDKFSSRFPHSGIAWMASLVAALMVGTQLEYAINMVNRKMAEPDVISPDPRSLSSQLAFDESYGFFDDISAEDWMKHQQRARNASFHRWPLDPTANWEWPEHFYYNSYDPIFTCPHVRRVTGLGDGPKWTCDPHRLSNVVQRRKAAGKPAPHCLIYSIGSNGNYDWEDGMFEILGPICEIHIFDYSDDYDRPKNKERNMHFHKLGLRGVGDRKLKGDEFATFPQILKRFGHEGKTIDIFKIDCEGCEWDSYQDWIDYDLRQVLIETHRLPERRTQGLDFFDSFAKNNLIMFSKEANPFDAGKCMEFSYVKLHPSFSHGQN